MRHNPIHIAGDSKYSKTSKKKKKWLQLLQNLDLRVIFVSEIYEKYGGQNGNI